MFWLAGQWQARKLHWKKGGGEIGIYVESRLSWSFVSDWLKKWWQISFMSHFLLWDLHARFGKRLVLGLGYQLGFASASASKCCWQVGCAELARLLGVSASLCHRDVRTCGTGQCHQFRGNARFVLRTRVSPQKKGWKNSDASLFKPMWTVLHKCINKG